MLPEIWEPDLKVLFAGAAVDELSDTLGFYYLHPRNRFWELLAIGGITPERIITKAERKALAEGHARGNLSDPVRVMFADKKTSQLLRLGVGVTDLNRRVLASPDDEEAAEPSDADIRLFVTRVAKLRPRIVAFVMKPDLFIRLLGGRYPDAAAAALGPQPFRIESAEVWFLGSPAVLLRGDALTQQEDAFFALGERVASLSTE